MLIYILSLIIFLSIDAVWLFSTSAFYKTKLGHLFAETPNFVPAGIFYLLYIAGLLYFVINPVLKSGGDIKKVIFPAFFFGVITYATYDLTNHATMKEWPAIVTCIDILWGGLLTVLTSVAVVYIAGFIK